MITCSTCGTEYDGAEIFCPKDGTRLIAGTERHKRVTIPPSERDSLIGKTIQGRYKVLELLGAGGMGVVYVAEHVEIEKKVALKVLRDDFSKRPEVVERFRLEARSASKIGNPHIVDVTDFGQLDDGGVYFTMELLKGESLSDLMRQGVLEVTVAVPIIVQIAKALQAAHDLSIVHRDLKPENVFLVAMEENEHFVKVLDFGIAKISDRDSEGKRLTQTGMIFGTPEYMSPEQAMGKPLDHRVDVYALGCIMYEMFVGTVPFDGDSFMAVLTQHMFEPVPRIDTMMPETDVPASIQNIVYRAMAKEADNRYADMTELETDLQAAFNDASYEVASPKGDPTNRHLKRPDLPPENWSVGTSDTQMDWSGSSESHVAGTGSKKGLVIGLSAALVAVVAGVVLYGVFWRDPKPIEVAPAVEKVTDTAAQIEKQPEEKDSASEKDTEPAEVVPPVAEKLAVNVNSTPPGAVVFIGDLGQVCSETPCELTLEVGKPIEIRAELGRKKAKMTFTPSSQNKEINLKLKGGSGRPPGNNTGGSNNNNNSSNNNELKIPGIFQDN